MSSELVEGIAPNKQMILDLDEIDHPHVDPAFLMFVIGAMLALFYQLVADKMGPEL